MTLELGLYVAWTETFYLKKKIDHEKKRTNPIICRFVHKSGTAAAVQHMLAILSLLLELER